MREREIREGRRYRNHHENEFVKFAESRGWQITKRGWPDFLCVTEAGEIIAVEVKRRLKDGRIQRLKRSQERVLRALSARGIQCFVSDGERLEPWGNLRRGLGGREYQACQDVVRGGE